MKTFNEIYKLSESEDISVLAAFGSDLEKISDTTKREKIEKLLQGISTRNIKEPASSSGKYHPGYARNDYGLLRHVKAVVIITEDICRAFPQLDKDTMIIAAIMHDIVKYKGDDAYTSKTHAKDGADLLRSVGLNDEARMVDSHMGIWSKDSPAPKEFDEQMLHLADYIASRQWCNIAFDKSHNTISSQDYKAVPTQDVDRQEKDDFEKGMDDYSKYGEFANYTDEDDPEDIITNRIKGASNARRRGHEFAKLGGF